MRSSPNGRTTCSANPSARELGAVRRRDDERLLEDLELVLVQIVQYTNHGTHSADDLDLIERSIRRRSVMSNIRNYSAGQLPSGT